MVCTCVLAWFTALSVRHPAAAAAQCVDTAGAVAALAAPVLTPLWAIVVAVRERADTVSHGPAMCLGAAAAVAVVIV